MSRYCMICAGNPETSFVPKRPEKHGKNCAGEVCLGCFVEMSFRHFVEKMVKFGEDPKKQICFADPGLVSSFMTNERFPCLNCTSSERVTKKMMTESGIYDEYLELIRQKISRWNDDSGIHKLLDIVEEQKETIAEYKHEHVVLENTISEMKRAHRRVLAKKKKLQNQLEEAGKMVRLKDQMIRFHIQNNNRILAKRKRLDE